MTKLICVFATIVVLAATACNKVNRKSNVTEPVDCPASQRFSSFNLFELKAVSYDDSTRSKDLCIEQDDSSVLFNGKRRIIKQGNHYFEQINREDEFQTEKVSLFITKLYLLYFIETTDFVDTSFYGLTAVKVYKDKVVQLSFHAGERLHISPLIDLDTVSTLRLYKKVIENIAIRDGELIKNLDVEYFDEIGRHKFQEVVPLYGYTAKVVEDIVFWRYYYDLSEF
ncbi:MAG TPA: hypothetical protein VK174_16405 [Chitinophagales bacterium]|nr:hypothetical protein [Chitinophagales bacterium]